MLEATEAITQSNPVMQRIEEGDHQHIAVYPNPNNGQGFILNASDVIGNAIDVCMIDALGKIVLNQTYQVDGSLSTMIQPNQDLQTGITASKSRMALIFRRSR